MRIICCLLLISCSWTNVYAQDEYEKVAATFILDSLTVYAVNDGTLNPADFIRYTMEDTSLFHGFALLKVLSHQMYMEAEVTGKKNRSGAVKRLYKQHVGDACRVQEAFTIDSSGYFFDKKGKPISDTYQMMMQFFTTPKRVCGIKLSPPPKGLVVLNQPKDIRQQKEFIKRFIFAPHTLRINVPLLGNKMKTNIFESPTADFYHFKVDFDMLDEHTPGYHFTIEVDSIKYPDWRKSVLIKKMHTTFRAEDMAIVARTYDLFYPGWLASCDLSIDIEMRQVENLLLPKQIHYRGEWKFPTKGKDKADILLQFNQVSAGECLH